MEYLAKLFGSPARVKLLRLFLFNPERVYDRDDASHTARITPAVASKELASLARAGIIKRKAFYKEGMRPGSKTPKRRKALGWVLEQKYPYRDSLARFMHSTLSVSDTEIRARLKSVGTLQLLVLAGFLINEKESPLDVLMVGERLNETEIQSVMRTIEAECGRDIRYTVLRTEDYLFRRRVRDKLVRDVMDRPHNVLIDRISE